MECAICHDKFNGDKQKPFCKSPVICQKCGINLTVSFFNFKEFNEWLDSFMQSRMVRYIPRYSEYFDRYNKQPCLDCHGTGFIAGQVCKTCNFVGIINKTE